MYLWKSWLLRKILLYTSDLSRNFERENLNKINSDVVSILYNNKESKVVKMIEQYAYYLSIGVNNAIMLYAPELVIFNSPLTKNSRYNKHNPKKFKQSIYKRRISY